MDPSQEEITSSEIRRSGVAILSSGPGYVTFGLPVRAMTIAFHHGEIYLSAVTPATFDLYLNIWPRTFSEIGLRHLIRALMAACVQDLPEVAIRSLVGRLHADMQAHDDAFFMPSGRTAGPRPAGNPIADLLRRLLR